MILKHMTDCVFCNIISGKWRCYKVYESETTLAFLDINPFNDGHTVVVPKVHVQDLTDFNEELSQKFMVDLVKVAKHIKAKLNPAGLNILQNNGKAAGQVVMHAHFHIIPRNEDDGVMKLVNKRAKPTEEELKKVYELLK